MFLEVAEPQPSAAGEHQHYQTEAFLQGFELPGLVQSPQQFEDSQAEDQYTEVVGNDSSEGVLDEVNERLVRDAFEEAGRKDVVKRKQPDVLSEYAC
jgi:hypothetical protein